MGIAVIPAPGGGVTQKVDVFNSTGTWTAPANCFAVEVFLVGGGGGGSVFRGASTTSGGGGGGGIVKRQFLPVTPGTSYTVTIGAGGAGASGFTNTGGGSGGDSSFGSLLTARGGGGGCFVNTSNGTGVAPTPRGTSAGYPGNSNPGMGGGGGGAARIAAQAQTKQTNTTPFSQDSLNYNGLTTFDVSQVTSGSEVGDTAGNGSYGVANFNYGVTSSPNPGIDGYGAGGAGAILNTSNSGQAMGESFNGLRPTMLTTGATANGANAISNSGCGGNGGATNQTLQFSSGNGGSGYCRIVYWS